MTCQFGQTSVKKQSEIVKHNEVKFFSYMNLDFQNYVTTLLSTSFFLNFHSLGSKNLKISRESHCVHLGR